MEILPFGSSPIISTGVLILDAPDAAEGLVGPETYALDLATGEISELALPGENWIYFAVSPDRTLMAIGEFLRDDEGNIVGKNLTIRDATGIMQHQIPWEDSWSYLTAWLNEQTLVIGLKGLEENSAAERTSTLLALDLDTGEERILLPEFPSMYNTYPLFGLDGWGWTVYDPTLNFVVFLAGADSLSNPLKFVLWDIQNNHELASLQVALDLRTTPRWSPDGEQFAFAPQLFESTEGDLFPPYEILVVNKTGEISRVTNLGAFYPWVYISDLSWSPDGRYIAFWYAGYDEKPGFSSPDGPQRLAVLDTSTGAVIDYCIPGDVTGTTTRLRIVPPPLWSPSGNQLVLESLDAQGGRQIILFDVETRTAQVVAEDIYVQGWLLNP